MLGVDFKDLPVDDEPCYGDNIGAQDKKDTMWGLVMKPFPKRYKKSDALQVQIFWVGARRSYKADP